MGPVEIGFVTALVAVAVVLGVGYLSYGRRKKGK